MVVLLATGAVPPAVAGLLAAGAIVLRGVLTIDQAYRGISWTTVILVGGMIPLSTAMTQTRRRRRRSPTPLVDIVGDAGPHALLLGLVRAHGRPRPADQQHGDGADRDPDRGLGRGRARRLAEAGADGGLRRRGRVVPDAGRDAGQPDGHGPGGYRFGDYWKLGLPMLVLFGVVAVVLVPLIWWF